MTRVICVCTMLVALLAVTGCKKNDNGKFFSKTGEPTAKAEPVNTEGCLIAFGPFPMELVSNGKLEAAEKVSLSFRNYGSIRRISAGNGDWVSQGTVIAELDNETEEIELEQARIRLEKARLERMNQIIGHKPGARKPEDIPPDILERFNISSGYREAELNLRQAEIRYGYTRLTAPLSGRVAGLVAKPGNVPATGKPCCHVIDDRGFEVVFPVMEGELARLKTGQEVAVEPFAVDSLLVTGKISEMDPMVDENGLIRVKARIPNSTGKLIDGMNVRVFIRYTMPDCLIIPKEALVLRNNRQVVFSLKNGRPYWNYVSTRHENSSAFSIRVLEGVLSRGDTVITRGNLNLAHDADIRFTFTETN